MRTITIRNLEIQFDADQVTHGTLREQAEQARDLINGVLQREPYGLAAQIITHLDDIEIGWKGDMTCRECGMYMTIDPTGVSHHLLQTGEIDYDRDAHPCRSVGHRGMKQSELKYVDHKSILLCLEACGDTPEEARRHYPAFVKKQSWYDLFEAGWLTDEGKRYYHRNKKRLWMEFSEPVLN